VAQTTFREGGDAMSPRTLTFLRALLLAGALGLLAASGDGRAAVSEAPSARAAAQPEAHGPALDYWSMLFVFLLATFVGLGVIRRVSRLLYTPLMSLTNAISAIAVVGALIVTGTDYPAGIRALGAVALFASMTNIVSGFLITSRMLKMFRTTRTGEPAGDRGGRDGTPNDGARR
jgi:NAD(P) transhydrogenase subunit alpha